MNCYYFTVIINIATHVKFKAEPASILMSFKYLPEKAIADIAYEVTSNSLDELFAEAAMAATDIMVNQKTVRPETSKTIKLSADSIENLLYDFLSELVFLKDTKGFLSKKISASVKTGKKFSLTAKLQGEKIDRKRHELRNDLKAITMHMFSVKQEGKNWKAMIVVDI